METKVCSTCGEEKPLTEEHYYWRNDSNTWRNQCKPCRIAQSLQSLNGRYNQYRTGARDRGHDFEVSKETFHEITQQPCYYCGDHIGYCKTEDNWYCGIDRKDSALGYIEGNMVPCCSNCNLGKQRLSVEDFIELCKKVAKKHSTEEE